MTRWREYVLQFAIMTAAVAAIIASVVNGLRGVLLALVIVTLTTAAYTGIDALQPDATPRDPAWVRRAVTGNLVYVAVIAVLYLVFAELL